LSNTLRVTLDLDPPGAAGLAIRRIAADTDATVTVSHRTYSYLRRDCGGSDKRATRWLADLAAETGKPIALNLPDGPDRSVTTFISPPDWTAERLQGYIAGRHAELEAVLGEVAEVRSVGVE
jgi:hypothetical protein